MNRILVIGGTGTVGRQVVSQLCARGACVRALARNPTTAGLPPQVEVVRGDLTLPETLDGCLKGIDTVRLKTSDPQAVKLQMRDTRRFVESRLEDLSALWDGEPRIAREEIAKHVGKITLKPMLRMYIATGVWVWLGVLGTAAVMCAGGPAWTERLPVRFEWLAAA
jgi:hypothetical protein